MTYLNSVIDLSHHNQNLDFQQIQSRNLSHLGPGTPHRTALPCRSIGIYPPLAPDLSMLP